MNTIRKLKISSMKEELSIEEQQKNQEAIAVGSCFAGFMSAMHFLGSDANQAIIVELETLDAAKREYLKKLTPAMYGNMVATAASTSMYIKQKRKFNNANIELLEVLNTIQEQTDTVEPKVR